MSFIESREKLYRDTLDWAFEIGSINKIDPQKAESESAFYFRFLTRLQNAGIFSEEEFVYAKKYLRKQIADSATQNTRERCEEHYRATGFSKN